MAKIGKVVKFRNGDDPAPLVVGRISKLADDSSSGALFIESPARAVENFKERLLSEKAIDAALTCGFDNSREFVEALIEAAEERGS